MSTVSSNRLNRIPRWLTTVLSLLCLLLGLVLVSRPFQSLSVLVLSIGVGMILLGLSDLFGRSDAPNPTLNLISALVWVGLGLVGLFLPGLSLQLLSILVGVGLVISGVARIVACIRGTADFRLASLLFGAAAIFFGLVSLAWPDVTLLVVSLVFGVALMVYGLSHLIGVFRQKPPDIPESSPGIISRFIRTIGAALAFILALAAASVSLNLKAGAPTVDAFYTAPVNVPTEPGVLLRVESFDRALPANAAAWRILYTTTRSEGVPAIASGLVVAPRNLPDGERPIIAWAHGTTGVDERCAPSLLADPFTAGATPALDQIVDNGWAMVATDYIGLGTAGPHAYLVGQEAGRAVLDGIRAARQVPELALTDETVVWGHSQGGGAALWTGILAPDYAPDANVIGVAALAPASQLTALVDNLNTVPGGSIFASYVVQGYSDVYEDMNFNDYIRPQARVLAREMAARCLAEPAVFASILESFVIGDSILANNPPSDALNKRLQDNVPGGPIPAPLLLGQGLADVLVLPAAQDAYVAARCSAGYPVDYRTYEGYDHVGVVGADSPLIPELLAWTQERFDGLPALSNCP